MSRIARKREPASFEREAAARASGVWPVAGVDEVGRGPLAGPVVVAAVILDPDRVPDGLADSKDLSATRREVLFDLIMASADVAIASASPETIDAMNIRAATLDAMARAINALSIRPALALIDGRDCPLVAINCQAIIGGDSKVASIAAASIIAKVTRDRLMHRLDMLYPLYGFAAHMGYGTARHLAALTQHGPCIAHRRSFAPLRIALKP
jgi:ribonuclease HII